MTTVEIHIWSKSTRPFINLHLRVEWGQARLWCLSSLSTALPWGFNRLAAAASGSTCFAGRPSKDMKILSDPRRMCQCRVLPSFLKVHCMIFLPSCSDNPAAFYLITSPFEDEVWLVLCDWIDKWLWSLARPRARAASVGSGGHRVMEEGEWRVCERCASGRRLRIAMEYVKVLLIWRISVSGKYTEEGSFWSPENTILIMDLFGGLWSHQMRNVASLVSEIYIIPASLWGGLVTKGSWIQERLADTILRRHLSGNVRGNTVSRSQQV